MKTASKKFLKVIFMLSMLISKNLSGCPGPNLVLNGGFENGIVDFGSQLTQQFPFWTANPYLYGYYDVTNNAANEGSQYNGGPYTGNLFFVADAASNIAIVWAQTVNGLTAGVPYTFTFWVRAISGGGDPGFLSVIYDINTVAASGIGTTQNWVQQSATIIPTSSTATIVIVQNACPAFGYDFAIDDISLTVEYNLNLSTIVAPVTCNDNGAAHVDVTGGFAPYYYQWSPSGGTSLLATGLTPGIYSVQVTDALGCTAIANVVVTSIQIPGVDLGSDLLKCDGSSVNLNAGSFIDYQWSQPPPYNCLFGGANMVACNSGTYCVTVTDANNCNSSDCINITISSPVNINILYGPPNPCPGDEINLGATGCPSCNVYQWSNGQNGQSISDNIYTTTTYTVTATNADGCTGIASVEIDVRNDCELNEFCKYIENLNDFDAGYAIEPTPDGGYVIAGTMYQGSSDKDVFFAKLDASFNIVSKRRIGENIGTFALYQEEGYSIVVGPDAYYVVGEAKSNSTNSSDVFVAKIDAVTNLLSWANLYGGPRNEVGVKGIYYTSASSPSLIIAGYSNSLTTGDYDILALKIDASSGAFQGMNTYAEFGLTVNEFGTDIIQVGGTNEFIITGRYVASNEDIICIKILPSLALAPGVTPWRTTGIRNEVAFSLEEIGNNVYLMGRTSTWGSGNNDIYIVEADKTTLLPTGYTRTYNVNSTTIDQIYHGQKTDDNHLVVVGDYYDTSPIVTRTEGLIMKIRITPNVAGNLQALWTLATSHKPADAIYNICESNPDHVMVIGKYGISSTDEDLFFSRINHINHNTEGCCYKSILMNENSGINITFPNLSFKATSWVAKGHMDTDKAGTIKILCEDYIPSHHRFTLMRTESAEHTVTQMEIFPNPNNGNFTVQLNTTSSGITEILIGNMEGKILETSRMESFSKSVAVESSAVPAGIYFVTATTEDGSRYTKKIAIYK